MARITRLPTVLSFIFYTSRTPYGPTYIILKRFETYKNITFYFTQLFGPRVVG